MVRSARHIKAARSEIARRYDWHARQLRKERGRIHQLASIRLREFERLLEHRYGCVLPDDDAGRDDLEIAAHHIAFMGGDIVAHITKRARVWAPWMPDAEVLSLADTVLRESRRFTADVLGWRMRLSLSERTALEITTIGSYDAPKAVREEIRKEKRRQAERERRRRIAEAEGRALRPKPGRPRK